MSKYTSSATLPQGEPFFGWDMQSKPAVTTPALSTPTLGDLSTTPDINTGASFDFNAGLSAAGTLASVIGGVMANRSNEKYRKGLMEREDKRIDRARKKQDKFEADMSKRYA